MKIKSTPIAIVASLTVLTMLSSCATIVSGTHESVKITSTPPGATVKIDDVVSGTTPMTAKLRATKDHMLRIEMAGYNSYEVKLRSTSNGWVWGNIFFGGLIGIVIDMSDGAAYALDPNKVDAQLLPAAKGRKGAIGSNRLFVITFVQKADPNWRKIGQIEKL